MENLAALNHRVSRQRAPLDLLALGGCWSLAGVLFYFPLLLSPAARQDDRFLSNIVLGLGLFLVGSTVLVVAMRRAALLRGHIPVLVVACGLLLLALTPGGGALDALPALGFLLAGYTAAVLALGALMARRRGQLGAWGRGLALALGGVAVIGVCYLWLGGRVPAAGGASTLVYLDGVTRVVTLVLGPVVYLIGRIWSELD
ncbi:MAG TPA: hypothetical protein VGR57_06355 [Ktedonobacterales bacterium]|nr:hypothetical protein [Ktedonobacterales bacterium]